MKIYDISRGMFSTPVYPGDPPATARAVRQIAQGSQCNLSEFSTGCHTATHIDAPLHFVPNGATIDQIPLDPFLGPCTVVTMKDCSPAQRSMRSPRAVKSGSCSAGTASCSCRRAPLLRWRKAGSCWSARMRSRIGPMNAEQPPHFELLSAGIPILEGLDLSAVEDGTYQLIALPLKLEGLEASPCRAVLLQEAAFSQAQSEPVEYREVRWNTPEYQEMLSLRNRILRKPLGLDLYEEGSVP